MKRWIAAVGLLCAQVAAAQDGGVVTPPLPPPPAEVIKQVLEYYLNGKDRGPALLEVKPCLKVDSKEGPTRFECLEPVTGPVKKNTTVHAWTLWYVPEGGNYDDISVQYLHEGVVRSTIDLKLDRPGRSRTWRASNLAKSGKWTIKILRGTTELGLTTVTVID
jgi:hypothetical protein